MIHTSSILFQALWRLWRQNTWWRDFTPGPNMCWSDYGSIAGTWPPLVNLPCLDVLTIQTMPKWSEDIWPYLVLGSISLIHYKLQTFFSKMICFPLLDHRDIMTSHDLIYPDIFYGYTPYVLAMSNHFRVWYHAISCSILIGAAPFCSFQAKQGFSET